MKKSDIEKTVEQILDVAMLSLSDEAFDVVLEAREWENISKRRRSEVATHRHF